MNKEKKFKIFLIVLIVILILVIIFWIKFVFMELYYRNREVKYAKNIYEKNKTTIFKISKIISYSGADVQDNSENLQDFNISQYSDLAIFIDNKVDIQDLTEENTIKELYLDNFKIELPKNIGKDQDLFYKNPYYMGKYRNYKYNRIDQKLEYDIIFKNEENSEEFYNSPVFFTDCSNPISLSYINENIYENYAVPKNGSISYDGRIFNDIDIRLEDIIPKISFSIHIKNNLNEDFVCNVSTIVNLKNNEVSISSGYFIEIEEFDKSYKFYKV